MGNGVNVLFWHHVWFGAQNLKEAFPRLYSLSLDKCSSVSEVGWWVEAVWRWRWRWRISLFAWEEEVL